MNDEKKKKLSMNFQKQMVPISRKFRILKEGKKKFKGCPRKKDFNFKFKNKDHEKKFFLKQNLKFQNKNG